MFIVIQNVHLLYGKRSQTHGRRKLMVNLTWAKTYLRHHAAPRRESPPVSFPWLRLGGAVFMNVRHERTEPATSRLCGRSRVKWIEGTSHQRGFKQGRHKVRDVVVMLSCWLSETTRIKKNVFDCLLYIDDICVQIKLKNKIKKSIYI